MILLLLYHVGRQIPKETSTIRVDNCIHSAVLYVGQWMKLGFRPCDFPTAVMCPCIAPAALPTPLVMAAFLCVICTVGGGTLVIQVMHQFFRVRFSYNKKHLPLARTRAERQVPRIASDSPARTAGATISVTRAIADRRA